jgi:hypothetical protein
LVSSLLAQDSGAADRQGSWGRHRWGSFGSESGRDDESSANGQGGQASRADRPTASVGAVIPSDTPEAPSSPPSVTSEAPGSLLGPSGSENEAPLETFPSILDDLGETTIAATSTQEAAPTTTSEQEAVPTTISQQEAAQGESSSGIVLIPITDGAEVSLPVEASLILWNRP